jgi:hypothetical protein
MTSIMPPLMLRDQSHALAPAQAHPADPNPLGLDHRGADPRCGSTATGVHVIARYERREIDCARAFNVESVQFIGRSTKVRSP